MRRAPDLDPRLADEILGYGEDGPVTDSRYAASPHHQRLTRIRSRYRRAPFAQSVKSEILTSYRPSLLGDSSH